jgi:hypothetical protein
LTSKYQPDFDHDFRKGQVGEELINTFLAALQGTTIETKTDSRAWETGNVYIETWQYHGSEDNKKQSGINISKSDFYCFAAPQGNGFICIKTEDLKEVIKDTQAVETRQPVWNESSMASIGRLVRVSDIVKKIGLGKL